MLICFLDGTKNMSISTVIISYERYTSSKLQFVISVTWTEFTAELPVNFLRFKLHVTFTHIILFYTAQKLKFVKFSLSNTKYTNQKASSLCPLAPPYRHIYSYRREVHHGSQGSNGTRSSASALWTSCPPSDWQPDCIQAPPCSLSE